GKVVFFIFFFTRGPLFRANAGIQTRSTRKPALWVVLLLDPGLRRDDVLGGTSCSTNHPPVTYIRLPHFTPKESV
ncbi:MAG: hypothetical protein P4M02_01610, partial [Clostridia bacterium]|nr:hypothetical protein [Clostridia bacterium]